MQSDNADTFASSAIQEAEPLNPSGAVLESTCASDDNNNKAMTGAVHDAAAVEGGGAAEERDANALTDDKGADDRSDNDTSPSLDTDDGDDEGTGMSASSDHATGNVISSLSPSSPSSSVESPASCDASSSTASRKRPLDMSPAAMIKQQQQQVRKRRYVDSSHTVDGVRKHVTVACARVDTGGFKCTFTLEHRRLEGTLNQQRANAKGGDIIERRHDVFMIQDAQGDDAPFPDYDRVYDNFLRRGIDICDHVRSELVPIRAAPKESAPTDDSVGANDAAS
ncbi:hypothetical protein pneo_cds_122 [Pandoravirus neocaledonia]|uniref:Uncharacterized protein n=1 Tax=Pandoravirus neocaledonia TaxID=2107708 RepID=A0A2U7UBA8_9VIRU|nr:hypothetical protein pneo_cds_122 [Pandoravirus neocaledonia]AVK75729.1 hypothetical protein pneo_cds_122 [Pandoravirus neocaledonia]